MVGETVKDARLDALDELIDIVYVQGYEIERTNVGGEKRTKKDLVSYKGLLQSVAQTASEFDIANKTTAVERFIVVLPWDAEVENKDRITVGSDVFEVMESNAGESNRLTMKVQVERVK